MYKILISVLLGLLVMPIVTTAKVLPGLVDRAGNPIHSADEFNLLVTTTVAPDPQGYRYIYDLSADINSVQPVWHFMILLPDVAAFIPSSSYSPWGNAGVPKVGGSKQAISVRWAVVPHQSNIP